MSKPAKEFRELQFSTGQLAAVFICVLVLGVFIFLLGVSVGKKQGQLQASSGAPSTSRTETVASKTPVSPDLGPVAKDAAPSAKTEGKVEPPGAVRETALKPETKTIAKDAVPSAKTDEKAEPPAPTGAKKPAGAKTDTDKPAAKTPAPAKAGAKTPPAKTADYYVQVGAVTDRPAADGYARKIAGLGFAALVINPSAGDKPAVYRVRIGPYPDKEEAEAARTKLAAALKKKRTDFFLVKG
jgi:cell division protein FtsN